jgi:hypothetical protein
MIIMKPNKTQAVISDDKLLRAHANKIKKWLETVNQLQAENFRWAIPITRLTSIKSLCQDEVAAGHFALYLVKVLQNLAFDASCPDGTTPEEWEIHKNLITDAIAAMECYIETPTSGGKQCLFTFLRRISELQGDNFRRIHWTTVHFVKSGYLLKLDYAIRCFTDSYFPYYAYKLAREYTELYKPEYGTGLIPESASKLLEIAEFWCQYYFEQSLAQKFDKLMITNSNSIFMDDNNLM